LEQFEPVPLLTVFLGGINISITNVTIIFIYIVLVLCYFINGHILTLNNVELVKVLHRKKGTLTIESSSDVDFMSNIYNITLKLFDYPYFHSDKMVSYLNYLDDAYIEILHIRDFKGESIGVDVFSSPSLLKSEYSQEFHRTLFNVLYNKSTSISDTVFFNNIQLYCSNFLNTINCVGIYSPFREVKDLFTFSNFLYFFATRAIFFRPLVPYFNMYTFENIYNLILGMVKENIGGNLSRAIRFFPFVFTLFVFILLANLIGLIPYSSTVTSYLIVTFAMAIMVLIGVNVVAGRLHGSVYFGHFLPAGCPFALYPLIIPIEFISYVFRVVSLSVRLFANMMAGHTLLAVLAGFGWTMANTSTELLIFHPLPILVVFVLVFLETAVAIIQAYVFTILTCMYLDEAMNLH
jgi:ATP synthase subunit 6